MYQHQDALHQSPWLEQDQHPRYTYNPFIIYLNGIITDLTLTPLLSGFIQQQSSQEEEEEEAKPSLAALKSLTALKTLSLEHPYLSDIALSPLSSLTGLTHLSLKSKSLTDSTLHHLSSLPNLVSLGFQDAVLTNLGLETFKPPSSLRTLDLRGCWLLTEAAVTGLCKKHPHIKVMHEFALESSSLDQNKILPRSSPPQSVLKVGRRRNNQSPETSAAVSRSFIGMPFSLTSWEMWLAEVKSFNCLIFVDADQRVKYNREDLFALQDSPLSRLLPQEGEFVSVPEILADGNSVI